MSEMQFIIPLQRQDLLSSSGRNEFRVATEYSIRELKIKLRDVQQDVQDLGAKFIVKDGFDVLFSVLTNFHKEMPPELKQDALEVLCQGTADVIRTTDLFLCSTELGNSNEKKGYATRMKMIVYLLCQMVELLEAQSQQNDSASIANAGGKGKRNRQNKAARLNAAEDGIAWDWDMKKSEIVTLIFRLLSLNLNSLFDPPLVEEELINLLGNCMFRLLENPTIAHQRCKDVRTSIIQVLGQMNSKYNYSLSCRLKIVQSLKHFEHLVSPLAEAVEAFVLEFNCRSMVLEVIREITRLDTKELNRDTSGTRSYSLFLIELSERLPENMKPCVSLLLIHLDNESYMLRKSILFVLAEIVGRIYSIDSLDDAAKETRDQYLECLQDHIHDGNAHVRSGVLQAWSKLCTNKLIPLSRQYSLLELVVGRLEDRSSNVRKQAIQLLTALLQFNPFNATLPVEELKEQYDLEKKKLEGMKPPDKAEEEAKKLRQWIDIEKGLTEFINEMEENTENDDVWENASPGEIHERIRHHLIQQKYGHALSLFNNAKKTFPIFQKLEKQANEDDGDEHTNENNPMVDQLRTIFFMPLTERNESATQEQSQNSELTKQEFLVNYLKDSVNFAGMIDMALPVVCKLLGSKQVTDVLEAIQFFVSAWEFGVLNAMIGVRQMLSLIFSREQTIQTAVVQAYKRLYIDQNDANAKTGAVQMVKNLTALISGATIGDLAGLEELIGILVKGNDIDKNCYQVMWQVFTKVMPDASDEQSQAALVLIGMVASSEPAIVISNVNVLVEHGLGERGEKHFRLAHDTFATILKISTATKTSSTDSEPPFKFPHDHELFVRLEKLLVDGILRLQDNQYIPMAQQAIAVLYRLSEYPDKLATGIIKRLAELFLTSKDDEHQEEETNGVSKSIGQEHLKRLVFVVGHVAVCQLNYLDVLVFNELKRRNNLREQKKEKENAAKKKGQRKSKGGSTSNLETPRGTNAKGKEEDDEMDVIGAQADDEEQDFIRSVCEKEILSGDNLLGLFSPLIKDICSSPTQYPDPKLRASATLSLAKFMLVSEKFCENNLQLLFTVLDKSSDATVRANTIIAAGDLSFRFPNTVEPWTPRMYACLRDDSSLVRSNTLTVLTHLILNDMIKVKGQISDMALLIVDGVTKISNMAKLFFTELARKGNALYNVMPDIISGLSNPEAGIEEASFREVMKYIIALIEKDKHLESLVEKLCLRFRVTKTERQWRDLAFCLSMFNYNEKAIKKLVDNFACYSDKLHEDYVYEAFNTIITQTKKGPRQEGRLIVDELNGKVEEARAKGVEDDTTKKRANEATKAKGKNNEKSQKKKGKTPRKKIDSSSEEESEEDIAEGSDDAVENQDELLDQQSSEKPDPKEKNEEEFLAPPPPSANRPKRSTRTSRR